jgi:hypothetical protein
MKKQIFLAVFALFITLSACKSGQKASANQSSKTSTGTPVSRPPVPPPPPSVMPPPPPPPIEKVAEQHLEPNGVVVKITRSSCYGKCPTYEFTIMSDGTVHWRGIMNVEKLGDFTAKVPTSVLADIKKRAAAIKYFSMQESYPSPGEAFIADLPACTTYIFDKNREKRIINRHDGPEELRDFQNYLDEVFRSISNWTSK